VTLVQSAHSVPALTTSIHADQPMRSHHSAHFNLCPFRPRACHAPSARSERVPHGRDLNEVTAKCTTRSADACGRHPCCESENESETGSRTASADGCCVRESTTESATAHADDHVGANTRESATATAYVHAARNDRERGMEKENGHVPESEAGSPLASGHALLNAAASPMVSDHGLEGGAASRKENDHERVAAIPKVNGHGFEMA